MVTMGTGTFRGPATRRSGRVGLTSFTPASIVGKPADVGEPICAAIQERFFQSRTSATLVMRISKSRESTARDISSAAAHGYLAHP
jgi:hypothetical protein